MFQLPVCLLQKGHTFLWHFIPNTSRIIAEGMLANRAVTYIYYFNYYKNTLCNYIVLCVGRSKQKECFIYHKVASVLYEK